MTKWLLMLNKKKMEKWATQYTLLISQVSQVSTRQNETGTTRVDEYNHEKPLEMHLTYQRGEVEKPLFGLEEILSEMQESGEGQKRLREVFLRGSLQEQIRMRKQWSLGYCWWWCWYRSTLRCSWLLFYLIIQHHVMQLISLYTRFIRKRTTRQAKKNLS